MIDLDDIGAAAFIAVQGDDGSFTFEQFNTAAERLTGMDRASTIGRPLGEMFTPEVARLLQSNYAECLRRGTVLDVERMVPLPLGALAIRTTLTPIFGASDAPTRRVLGVSVDVTEQHRLQEDLKRTNVRLAIAMEALGGVHWFYDPALNTFNFSAAFEKVLGDTIPLKMHVEEWLTHVHPDDRDDTCFADIMAGWIEQGTAEFRVFDDRGDMHWLRCRRRAVTSDPKQGGIAGVVIDVTQEKRREAALSLQAASDPLTGLANRRRFEETLRHARDNAAQRSEALSLIMIDVDLFKAYNDTYGHVAGDAVLRRVGDCLRQVASAHGGLAARYGGEEFVIVLPRLDLAGAAPVAEAVLDAIAALDAPHSGSPAGRISVSLGLSGHPGGPTTVKLDLVALADAALYQAKDDGRNCYRVMLASHLRGRMPERRATAA